MVEGEAEIVDIVVIDRLVGGPVEKVDGGSVVVIDSGSDEDIEADLVKLK